MLQDKELAFLSSLMSHAIFGTQKEIEGGESEVCWFKSALENVALQYGNLCERDPLTMYIHSSQKVRGIQFSSELLQPI